MKKIATNVADLIGVEVHHMGDQMKVLKVGMPLTNVFFDVLEEVCKTRGKDLRRYVTEALHDQLEQDLDTPQDLGLDYCNHLKNKLQGKIAEERDD